MHLLNGIKETTLQTKIVRVGKVGTSIKAIAVVQLNPGFVVKYASTASQACSGFGKGSACSSPWSHD